MQSNQILKKIIFNSPSLVVRKWKHIGGIFVRYVLAVILTLSAFAGQASASGPRCEDIFKEMVVRSEDIIPFSNENFVKIYKEEYDAIEQWWGRPVVKVMRGSIKNKVVEACKNGCSEKEISRVVADSIQSAFSKIDKATLQAKRIRGYAILTGITVGTIVGGSYLKGTLPDQRFLTDVISTVTTIAIYKLGAPVLDQVTALAVRGGYRLQDGKEFFRKNVEYVRMRALYRILREKMTPLEQEEAGRVSNLLGQLAPALGTAIESMDSMDRSKGGMQAAAARIADMAIRMRQYFPEIRPNDPEILRTVDMVFTQRVVAVDPSTGATVPDRQRLQSLYELVIKQIEKYDPLYRESPDAADVYRNSIKEWLGLKSPSSQD